MRRSGESAGPRIAVLGLHLEANAFAPPTRLEDFAGNAWCRARR